MFWGSLAYAGAGAGHHQHHMNEEGVLESESVRESLLIPSRYITLSFLIQI